MSDGSLVRANPSTDTHTPLSGDGNRWPRTFLVLVDGEFLQLVFVQAAPASSTPVLDELGDLRTAETGRARALAAVRCSTEATIWLTL